MKETFKLIRAEGYDVSLLTLQLITHKSGETYAYSNRAPQAPVQTPDGSALSGISYSCYNVNTKQVESATTSSNIQDDGKIHTFWLNGVDSETIELWKSEYGELAIGYVDEDGMHILTEDDAKVMFLSSSTSETSQSASQTA